MEYGDGKKSMWQWVAIYLIVGLIVYGVVYYFFFMKKGEKNMYGQTTQTVQELVTPMVTEVPMAGKVTTTRVDAAKGSYLADTKGMTLYTFDNDKPGVSNCSGTCLVNWPSFVALVDTTNESNLSVITRSDGSKQYAWMGMPLYYYIKDVKAGDLVGDGVGSIWHIVKL